MQVKLTIIKGPYTGKEYLFHEHANFFVGRGPQARFRLTEADRFFSRLIFMVEVNPSAGLRRTARLVSAPRAL